MRIGFLAAAVITGLSLIGLIVVRLRPPETVLPNGFIIRGHTDVLSSDRRTVLSDDAEFLCFDDRFLVVTSMRGGKRKLFDSRSQGQTDDRDHPELHAPGGLLHGRHSCNGYHTAMIGPGLLHDGAKWPFLPECEHANTGNPGLKDQDWLKRPCADH